MSPFPFLSLQYIEQEKVTDIFSHRTLVGK